MMITLLWLFESFIDNLMIVLMTYIIV